jgi:glutathione peroxidase
MANPSRLRAFVPVAATVLALAGAPSAANAAPACPALLKQTMPRLQDEQPVDLCRYAGQVVLVVNTASQCGFTPQYKSLETLYERYKGRGLVVLGFPSNDFGQQEPGSNAQIADFCENQFAVRFPMFAKTTVSARSSKNVNPLYAQLTAKTGQAPKWNFHKYLIDRRGETVLSRASEMDPLDPAFVKDVEKLLDAKLN